MMSSLRGAKLWLIVVAVLAAATAAAGRQVFIGTWQLLEAEPARFTFVFAEDGDFEAVVPASMFFEADEDEADNFNLEPFFEVYEYRLMGWREIDEDGLWICTDEAESGRRHLAREGHHPGRLRSGREKSRRGGCRRRGVRGFRKGTRRVQAGGVRP